MPNLVRFISYGQNSSKSNRKIVEIGQIDTHNTQIHDRSHSWHGTDTSIKCGCVKLV